MKRIRANVAFQHALGVIVFSAFFFCAGAARAYEREETFHKQIQLQGAKRVVITNTRGDVRVIGEKGRSDISCEYTKRIHGKDRDEVNRLFDRMDIEVEREGAGIKLTARYPDRSDSERNILALLMKHYAGLSVDMNVLVPAGLDVKMITSSGDVQLASVIGTSEITSASGDVEVTGVGNLKVDVSSGDIIVSSVAGDAFLSSASGDIEAHNVKGAAVVQAASGDIVLSDIGGDLTVASVSGDTEVDGAAGVVLRGTSGNARLIGVRRGVAATVASGDVEVSAAPESGGDFEIRTSSGQIELRFESALKGGFALKAQTTSGDISVNLPIKVTKISRHYLTGVIREGKSVVVLETASGDIAVSEQRE
jgi:DUF4097 and DUF4098 domain-containing protein YvlB